MKENPSPIEEVKTLRERLGIKESRGLSELVVLAGSVDPQKREEALEELERRWHLQPEQSSENAPSVDAKAQIERFPEEERKLILKLTVAAEQTVGCNGRCFFCFLSRETHEKRGVTAKYSFDSLEQLLEEYGDLIPKEITFFPYWESDPFDYADGDRSFVDMYEILKEKDLPLYISTSIPPGSQKRFIKFAEYVAEQYFSADVTPPPVRLSVGKHNIQRVEATLKVLAGTLKAEHGYREEQVNDFFGKCFEVGARARETGTILPVGPLIDEADPYRDVSAPSCRDGVVLSPKGPYAILLVAATRYHPSGEIHIPIRPGEAAKAVPTEFRLSNYIEYSYSPDRRESFVRNFKDRQRYKNFFMGESRRAEDGGKYDLTELGFSTCDQVCFLLSRNAVSLDCFVSYVRMLGGVEVSDEDLSGYLGDASPVFSARSVQIEGRIAKAQKMLEAEGVSEDDKEKLEYFITLTQLHLAKVDLLFNLLPSGWSPRAVSHAARVLEQIGEKQVPHLEEILDTIRRFDIGELVVQAKEMGLRDQNDLWDWIYGKFVPGELGKFWGVDIGTSVAKWPNWLWNLNNFIYNRCREKLGFAG